MQHYLLGFTARNGVNARLGESLPDIFEHSTRLCGLTISNYLICTQTECWLPSDNVATNCHWPTLMPVSFVLRL